MSCPTTSQAHCRCACFPSPLTSPLHLQVNPVLLDVPTGLEEVENEETGNVLDEDEEEVEEEGAIVQDPSDVKEAEPKLLKVRWNAAVSCYGLLAIPPTLHHACYCSALS